ncbi:MAG: AMIN domain-containing protein [Elusimicrobia bacterium]|nr:AMIN domain-containing protein [Elusimicrobiota bacterium]
MNALAMLALFAWMSQPALAEDFAVLQKIGVDQNVVALELSAAVKYQILMEPKASQLIVDLEQTRNRARPKVVDGDGGLIRQVRSAQYAPGPNWATRVVLDLNGRAGFTAQWEGSVLKVMLSGQGRSAKPAAQEKASKPASGDEFLLGPSSAEGQGGPAAPKEAAPHGKPAESLLLQVGPFPSEEAMKYAADEISAMGYKVVLPAK